MKGFVNAVRAWFRDDERGARLQTSPRLRRSRTWMRGSNR